jgi:hypothetical protein
MKRLLFITCAVILLMILLAVSILFLPPVFRFGLRTANRFLPVTVHIAGYHHVPGRLCLTGIRVTTDRATLCEVSGLDMEYRPLGFVFGRIEVSTLEIENPRITLRRSEDGRLDLFEPSRDHEQARGKDAPEDDESWTAILAPLRVAEVRVVEGSVFYEDLATGLSLAWESLNLEGAFSGLPLKGELRLRKGLLQASRDTHSPLRVSTEGRTSLSDGQLRLTDLRLLTEESGILLSGGYSLEGEKLALKTELNTLPLGQILAFFGVDGVEVEELSGALDGEITGWKDGAMRADLRGTVYGQRVRAKLSGSRAVFWRKESSSNRWRSAIRRPPLRDRGAGRLEPESFAGTSVFPLPS